MHEIKRFSLMNLFNVCKKSVLVCHFVVGKYIYVFACIGMQLKFSSSAHVGCDNCANHIC